MVSKCPGDRTSTNAPQASRREGEPRKLDCSLDLKLFSDLKLLKVFAELGFWENEFGVAQIWDQGPEDSRKRWTEKTSSFEASRTLRDDLEGLKHYACSGFEASRRADECLQRAQGLRELDP